jgi:hypothetical protein
MKRQLPGPENHAEIIDSVGDIPVLHNYPIPVYVYLAGGLLFAVDAWLPGL